MPVQKRLLVSWLVRPRLNLDFPGTKLGSSEAECNTKLARSASTVWASWSHFHSPAFLSIVRDRRRQHRWASPSTYFRLLRLLRWDRRVFLVGAQTRSTVWKT